MKKDAIDEAVLKLRIVISALVAGVASFGAITFLLVSGDGFTTDSSLQTPLVGALGAWIIGLLMAYPIVKKSLIKESSEAGLGEEEQLRIYSMLVVIRSAMIESVGLLGGVIYLVTAHLVGLLAIAASIGLLLTRLPSRQEAQTDLGGTKSLP